MPKADGAIAPDYITEIVKDYKAKYNIGSISSLARHFKVGLGVMQRGLNEKLHAKNMKEKKGDKRWSRATEIHVLKLIKKLGE